MLEILITVMPVFVVVGAGYGAAKAGYMTAVAIDGLLGYAAKFAVPCLLFAALYRMDLGASFDPRLLFSFYAGSVFSFVAAIVIARTAFKRRPGESIAIGFGALFSNSLMLGLPITERAYGVDALAGNYAIIAIHAPFSYLLGIVAMEASRADGRGLAGTLRATSTAMFRNTLSIGLALGFIANASGLAMPEPLMAGVDMLARSGLPVMLFALGGVLSRYAIRSGLGEVGMVATLSLMVHPAIAFALSAWYFDLSEASVRSIVVTASMAPGINAYLFAAMYQRAVGVTASIVLLATGLSVVTVTFWLLVLEAAGY